MLNEKLVQFIEISTILLRENKELKREIESLKKNDLYSMSLRDMMQAEERADEAEERIVELTRENETLKKQVEHYVDKSVDLEEIIDEKNYHIKGLEDIIEEKNEHIRGIEKYISDLEEINEDLETFIDELEAELDQYEEAHTRELEQKVWSHWNKIKGELLGEK